MDDQKSPLLVPNRWQEKFLLKRIDEQDIELSLEERNAILQALEAGAKFGQIRKYTIMLNTIKSIDPKWGESNIPPRPKPNATVEYLETGAVDTIHNQEEIDLWNKIFGSKLLNK